MNSVQIKVADKIVALAPTVEDKIVGILVDREVIKRSNALVIGIDKISTLEKDFNKIKPDQKSYDEEGKLVSETWSKKALDERNKLQVKINKVTKAVEKALENSDYGDVYNIAAGKEDDKQNNFDKTEEES